MNRRKCPIIAIANQKGGVGKTTTAINLSQALSILGEKIILVDLDPQGNATQGMGIDLQNVTLSIADLIREKSLDAGRVIYEGPGLDVIPATPILSRVERELVGMTNGELRLSKSLESIRDRYSAIILDTPPTFGPLMNSALNAADFVIVPVDSSFFALMGIKELLAEIEEIKSGTNPSINILGYLLTLGEHTRVSEETYETLKTSFSDLVFDTKIRRSVRLKEAPALRQTIFHYSPESSGAIDYLSLAKELLNRLQPHQAVSALNVGGIAHA